MTALLIMLAAIGLLLAGYVLYGAWLAKQWGIDPTRKTPAHQRRDGIDYVPAHPAVLMGHHFSSIAGAGPINGPILASVFGWVPVFLWCIIGGIFFGGLQDFGSLFASIRHDGKTVGEIIKDSIGKTAKLLFVIFALLVLILVLASFINIVAGTFFTPGASFHLVLHPTGPQSTVMISFLFILLAIGYGFLTNRFGVKVLPATIAGLIGVVLSICFGMYVGIAISRTLCIVIIGIYIAIASLIPVWMLLQPRDYLSSFLLYSMIAIGLIGIVLSAFTGNTTFELPLFTGWHTAIGPLFPALFITVACGACSGFHSLIATGTTSKQLDSEKNAQAISYGAMLIESGLGIISLIAIGMVSHQFIINGAFKGAPPVAFATGISAMFGFPDQQNAIYALLTLTVSVFALTTLDSATRLSRFMLSELFLKENERSYKQAQGMRKVLAHPLFSTSFFVVISCILGGLSLTQLWALFGSANQLLAGIALMAVAAWLGNAGKNNKMFFIPMVFMLLATLTQLAYTLVGKIQAMLAHAPNAFFWGNWFQIAFASAMMILAIILVCQGVKTFKKQGSCK